MLLRGRRPGWAVIEISLERQHRLFQHIPTYQRDADDGGDGRDQVGDARQRLPVHDANPTSRAEPAIKRRQQGIMEDL